MDEKKTVDGAETNAPEPMRTSEKIGKDVAEEILKDIYNQLGISMDFIGDDEDEKSTYNKLLNAIMWGRLEFNDGAFRQTLLSPITAGAKVIKVLDIREPSGDELREMRSIKKKTDDVGKALAVLGAVTGLGLPVVNTMKARDMMVAVGVMSLFL